VSRIDETPWSCRRTRDDSWGRAPDAEQMWGRHGEEGRALQVSCCTHDPQAALCTTAEGSLRGWKSCRGAGQALSCFIGSYAPGVIWPKGVLSVSGSTSSSVHLRLGRGFYLLLTSAPEGLWFLLWSSRVGLCGAADCFLLRALLGSLSLGALLPAWGFALVGSLRV